MSPQTTPIRLDLKRDEKLEIQWQDGLKSVYPISMLRSMCPCAMCRQAREEKAKAKQQKRTSLAILSGDHSGPLAVLSAELVGGYALRLDWSDKHGSGIYSFEYLRELSPE